MKTELHPAAHKTWPEAMATVLSCKYDFAATRALAFGIPTDKHFRITINYWAPNPEGVDELHTSTFTSEKPIPQGSLFPIHYNPAEPTLHSHATEATPTRIPLLAFGILGSILLSLAWYALMRTFH